MSTVAHVYAEIGAGAPLSNVFPTMPAARWDEPASEEARVLTRLRICGLEYRVVLATPFTVPELIENEGATSFSTGTIYVRENLTPSRMRDTLLHEVMHAFLEASGLREFLSSNLKSGEDAESFEETFIRLTVPSLLRLIDDNGACLLGAG